MARQSLLSRVGWFGVGGGLSVAINATLYFQFQDRLGWTRAGALAVSLVVVTLVFAVWNYFVNFRTDRGFRECLVRYAAAILCCYVLNYVIALTGIERLARTRLSEVGILFTVQVLVSGVKFLLYHHWVYPRSSSLPLPR